MNAKDCKYLDKDKIIPWLTNPEAWDDGTMTHEEFLGWCKAYQVLLDEIRRGRFDWNQGSE